MLPAHEKKIGHSFHGDQNGHSQPWLSRYLGRDHRDWAVASPWLSCDLAVIELWPSRDWAVT